MRPAARHSLVALLAALAAFGFGPALVRRLRASPSRAGGRTTPGRRVRPRPGAPRRACGRRELLRSVVAARGVRDVRASSASSRVDGGSGERGYAYLLYPHRPIVAYDTETGELLNEYCVAFPDRAEPAGGERLPDADDVLAKWMSLRGGERELISVANMHVPGRQVDPGQVRRDLIRLREWRARRVDAAA